MPRMGHGIGGYLPIGKAVLVIKSMLCKGYMTLSETWYRWKAKDFKNNFQELFLGNGTIVP